MIYIKKILFIMLISVFLSGCQDNMAEDKNYYFVGDSIIARWPLDETLPSQLVYNFGKSGAGISYIQELRGKFVGNDVVVLIGTNDKNYFTSEKVEDYLDKYLNSISQLTDRTIYLISVLPREFKGDSEKVNENIENFNDIVKISLEDYPNIIYIDVFNDFMYGDHINYQYYSDGLHLNIFGYYRLSSEVLRAIN